MLRKAFSIAAVLVLSVLAQASWAGGMVTLTFDDGLSSVYSKALPVLVRHGQAATVGVIASKLQEGDQNFLTSVQLKELQAFGWEVASHSLTNSRPLTIPGFYNQELITDWSKEADGSPLFQAEYLYDQIAGIYEGDKPLREVGSLDELAQQPGTWYFDRPIAALHVHPLVVVDPEKLVIRAGSYEREMDQSKRELAGFGFAVETFIAPGSYWTKEVKDACARSYAYAVADDGVDNHPENFDPHAIKRLMVRRKDPAASLIRIIQDHVVGHGGWVVLRLHGVGAQAGPEPISLATLEQLSNWLASEKIPVVTIAQGAARMAAMQSGLKGGGKAKVQKSAGASEVKAGKASSGKAEGKAVKTP